MKYLLSLLMFVSLMGCGDTEINGSLITQDTFKLNLTLNHPGDSTPRYYGVNGNQLGTTFSSAGGFFASFEICINHIESQQLSGSITTPTLAIGYPSGQSSTISINSGFSSYDTNLRIPANSDFNIVFNGNTTSGSYSFTLFIENCD